MGTLYPFATDVFDNMIEENHIKRFVDKVQLSTGNLPVSIAFGNEPVIVHIDRIHFAAKLRMRSEIMGNTA
jgi:UbiD family decarboxylase